jgi:hypothetical protein
VRRLRPEIFRKTDLNFLLHIYLIHLFFRGWTVFKSCSCLRCYVTTFHTAETAVRLSETWSLCLCFLQPTVIALDCLLNLFPWPALPKMCQYLLPQEFGCRLVGHFSCTGICAVSATLHNKSNLKHIYDTALFFILAFFYARVARLLWLVFWWVRLWKGGFVAKVLTTSYIIIFCNKDFFRLRYGFVVSQYFKGVCMCRCYVLDR